jgi:hypothetical protein
MDAEGREMGVDREARRLDAAAAERLLAGEDVGYDDLSELLAAAAGPTRPRELAGETRALVAFRHSRLAAPGQRPRRTRARTGWPRLAYVKTAAVAIALATAVAALAAGTGVLPTPFTGDPSAATPEVTSGRPRTSAERTGPGAGAGTPPGQGAPSATPTPSADATSSLIEMCRAHQALRKPDRDKALDDPSLRPLIDAAGGRDKVDRYCHELLGPPGGRPTKSPKNPPPSGPPASPGADAGTPPST